MTTRWSIPWGLTVLLSPALAVAHPGHGHTEPQTWQHWLVEPAHILPATLVLAVAVAGGVILRKLRRRSEV